MTLEKLGAGIDFVQDTTPAASDAIDGDVYVDTSLSPPQVKVFDGSVGSFVRPQTAQNLDQKVSNAGETATDKNTQSEIKSGVNAAETGIDWSTKTPKGTSFRGVSGDLINASGSGFITGIGLMSRSNKTNDVRFKIDGTVIFNGPLNPGAAQGAGVASLQRFETGFKIRETSNTPINGFITFVID
jgi:hypothetical protein